MNSGYITYSAGTARIDELRQHGEEWRRAALVAREADASHSMRPGEQRSQLSRGHLVRLLGTPKLTGARS
jgi:hypothetical protein